MTAQKRTAPQSEAVRESQASQSVTAKESPVDNVAQPSDQGVNDSSLSGDHPGPEIDPYAPEVNLVAGLDATFKKNVVVIKEGKPKKDEFFRINPDPDYTHDYWLLTIDDGMSKENFIILPSVRHLVPDNVHPYRVVVGINLHDTVFVWPVRLYTDGDGGNGGGRSWSDSALVHIETAKSLWIKIRGNRSSGAYEATEAQGLWEEPKWPADSFRDLMEKAFKGKVVDSSDHPAIRKIFGDGQR